MNEVQAKIEQLLDSRFVTSFLGLQCDEGYIAGHVTCLYLEDSDLESLGPLMDPPHHHADVGQVGCYRAKPICPKAKWKDDGQPCADYQGILFTYWVYREILPVSSFRDWLHTRKVDESKKRPAFAALDAYETLAGRHTISKADLAVLLNAVRSRWSVSREVGTTFLSRLAGKHCAARDVMLELMRTGKAPERARVLGMLWDHLPRSFCVSLLRLGLKDRSQSVRQTAANVCRCLILTEMAEELRDCAKLESDSATKWQMEHAVALIRDGYHSYTRDDGSEALVIRISDGFPAKLLWPGPDWCTDADLKQRGAKAVAEEVRRQSSGATARSFRWPAE